jgi:redox-sensing transcriptional repressor
MKQVKISDAVVKRLPLYLQVLNELKVREVKTVSSQELGHFLDFNPAQIRKDLAYFGDFGRKGIGYEVDYLIDKIRHILKINQTIFVALIGAGNLGHALCNYNKYSKDNMQIVAVFDSYEDKVGTKINNLVVQPMDELAETIKQQKIRIGIITVPAQEAQTVANQLIAGGIEGILNFAPTILRSPDEVRVQHADFTKELLSLAYYLNQKEEDNNESDLD